jgi:hypothetical protein
MKKFFVLCIIVLSFLTYSCVSASENNSANKFTAEDNQFIEKQIIILDEIIELHKTVKSIHPSLQQLYPVSIINNGFLFVFDVNEDGSSYEIKYKEETFLPAEGIIAAFVVAEDYPSAVVSQNMLEDPRNYVFIFHEFVHCFQYYNGERAIRNHLLIEKQEMAKNNYSWEIDYPFPYDDTYFIDETKSIDAYFLHDDLESMKLYHENMKNHLSQTEFEYMIWQEWKEGFARYVENLIRAELNMAPNRKTLDPPFDRTSFYEIGSRYIEMLIKRNPALRNNIEVLFQEM